MEKLSMSTNNAIFCYVFYKQAARQNSRQTTLWANRPPPQHNPDHSFQKVIEKLPQHQAQTLIHIREQAKEHEELLKFEREQAFLTRYYQTQDKDERKQLLSRWRAKKSIIRTKPLKTWANLYKALGYLWWAANLIIIIFHFFFHVSIINVQILKSIFHNYLNSSRAVSDVKKSAQQHLCQVIIATCNDIDTCLLFRPLCISVFWHLTHIKIVFLSCTFVLR